MARKHLTQVRVLMRAADVLIVTVTFGAALMTFEPVRQYGVSLFASAGVASIVAGLAARPVLSNLFAGVQLAMTQPIRIDAGGGLFFLSKASRGSAQYCMPPRARNCSSQWMW